MCEKSMMISFNRSRITYPVQESIFHNKNITESIWTKHEHMKQSNYKTIHKAFCYFLGTDEQNIS
jgi:hypothetical protein